MSRARAHGVALLPRGSAVPGVCPASGPGAVLKLSDIHTLYTRKQLLDVPWFFTVAEFFTLDFYNVCVSSPGGGATYTHLVPHGVAEAKAVEMSGSMEEHAVLVSKRVAFKARKEALREQRAAAKWAAQRAALEARLADFHGGALTPDAIQRVYDEAGFFGNRRCILSLQNAMRKSSIDAQFKATLEAAVRRWAVLECARRNVPVQVVGAEYGDDSDSDDSDSDDADFVSFPFRPAVFVLPAAFSWMPTSWDDVAKRAEYGSIFKGEARTLMLVAHRLELHAAAVDLVLRYLAPVFSMQHMAWVERGWPVEPAISYQRYPGNFLYWACAATDMGYPGKLKQFPAETAAFKWVVKDDYT